MNKYKRLDLTKLEYECLIEIIDFEKLKEIEKRYKEIEGFSPNKSIVQFLLFTCKKISIFSE